MRRLALGRAKRAITVPLAAVAIAAVATASTGTILIRVHRGDTLYQIAHDRHTTVDQLRRLNHIPADSSLILAGQLLRVPGNRPVAQPHKSVSLTSYTVRAGDSVTAIARHYGVSPATIMVRNHIPRSGLIVPGQRLTFPGPVHVTQSYPTATLRAAAEHRSQLAHLSVPSQSSARALVERTARAYGVDPTLALAIATMESGFQQRVVSPADAIGIMQVLPSTTQYISGVLHRNLDPLDATDNVRAGVELLHLLTKAAPLPQAVAGYYQGLGSVQSRGMYADTKHYVATVLAIRKQLQQ